MPIWLTWLASLLIAALPIGVRLVVLWWSKTSNPTWDSTWLRPEPFAFAISVSLVTLIRLVDRVDDTRQQFRGGKQLFWFCAFLTVVIVLGSALAYAIIVWDNEVGLSGSSGLETMPVVAAAISLVVAAEIASLSQLAWREKNNECAN